MAEEPGKQSRSSAFRTAISGFIEARRDTRLTGKDKGEDAVASRYEYGTWLADAARRVGQIQAVTHVLKATHPDARGSSLHVAPSALPRHTEIGSHLLEGDYAEDIVGNAAALDVFKFLKVEVEGRRLLDWTRDDDADLQAALSDSPELARGWMQAFAGLVRTDLRPASHTMAKQVYWLVGDEPQEDGHYHLLQPMFSSTLAHAVDAEIRDARFGEANKEARQAHRGRKPSATGYPDYRGLVARKLGGTKPQNISQLNSERGGINYLLSSLPPPAWRHEHAGDLSKRESALDALLWFGDVRNQVAALARLLRSDPAPTMDTRTRRERIERALGEELGLFGAAMRARYPAGWTRDVACRLPRCEQLWLDPGRVELPDREDPQNPHWAIEDRDFRDEYHGGDWADEVAGRFGLWVNQRLRNRGLAMVGDAEMRHWARQAVLDVAWPVPMQRTAPEAAA